MIHLSSNQPEKSILVSVHFAAPAIRPGGIEVKQFVKIIGKSCDMRDQENSLLQSFLIVFQAIIIKYIFMLASTVLYTNINIKTDQKNFYLLFKIQNCITIVYYEIYTKSKIIPKDVKKENSFVRIFIYNEQL